MAIISIGGVAMPSSSSLKAPEYDLYSGDTGRNQLGKMCLDPVRMDIGKLNIEWKGLSSAELNKIKSATRRPPFLVTYLSSAGNVTKSMYRGDRNIEIPIIKNGVPVWNLSMDLIEL